MSKYNILLDSLQLKEPISSYIAENMDLQNSTKLNNNPSLFKFLISEEKDVNSIVSENKFRMLKDNTTDAFVNEFFGDNGLLKMLIDYQYHFINFALLSQINQGLTSAKPTNRTRDTIETDNLYPLESEEHILFNFKGGSTMFFLYTNIISYLNRKGIDTTIDIDFQSLEGNFKISDIDMSLNIEADNSYRYSQMESICCTLLGKKLEELTNRLEFIFLNTIFNNLPDALKTPELIASIRDMSDKVNNNTRIIRQDIIISGQGPIYPDIYSLKTIINTFKENVHNPGFDFIHIRNFINNFIVNRNPGYTAKTVDMLELSYLSEFLSFLLYLEPVHNDPILLTDITDYLFNINQLCLHLLDSRFKYLTDNLYSIPHLNSFITKIQEGLYNINRSTLTKAVEIHRNELAVPPIFKYRECRGGILNNGTDDYYQEDRYFSEDKSGIKAVYNLNYPVHTDPQDAANEVKKKINFSGRENFILRPQDSSNYPYLLAQTSNTGKYQSDIDTIKTKLGLVDINFGTDTKTIDFNNNKKNIHYLSVNKSILGIQKDFIQTFNLFRIKFNIILDKLVDSVDVNNNCSTTEKVLNTPSEFLDIGISSKDDGFHHHIKKIEENEPGITFQFGLPQVVGLDYGKKTRITSYNMKIFGADLNNILFNQQVIPWLDLKYKKRLVRLLFYIFNSFAIYNQLHHGSSTVNQRITDIFNPFFGGINENQINFDSIFRGEQITAAGGPVNAIVNTFINHISIPNSNTFITPQSVKELIKYNKNINDHLLLKEEYKYTNGFYSFTIILLVLIQQMINDINNGINDPNYDQIIIIREYSKVIKSIYSKNGFVFENHHYGPKTQDEIDTIMITNFINDVKNYITNIKDIIRILSKIFTPDFDYDIYETIPY